MKILQGHHRLLPYLVAMLLCVTLTWRVASAADSLPSWNDGPAKRAIVDFVTAVSSEGSPQFVSHADRIAVFDNDGTLWVEQPMYTQLAFALERVRVLAPHHPEWKTKQPFQAVLDNDLETLKQAGLKDMVELVLQTHAGTTVAEFQQIVTDWLSTARHPRFGRPYTELAYQPMLELLDYLRANGFTTCIISGGGVEFMRPWSLRVYGVPPQQVIGSTIRTEYRIVDGVPALVRLPEIDFVDDKAGKPVGINKFLGRRPIAAFGNSDGDFEMLEWTTSGDGPRLGLIVHHDDAEREYAYDRSSSVGRLDKALDAAPQRGWTVVSMQRDWKRVFPEAP
jgi:hypothetical protein